MKTAYQIALDLIRSGIRETQGHNRSPEIDRIVSRFGGVLGAPYCAYGVSFCFYERKKQAEKSDKDFRSFPYSGSSQAIMRSFREMGKVFTDPDQLLHVKGAIGGWTLSDDPNHGHVFLIGNRYTDAKGRVVAIGTAEFNTSIKTKERDGEGAFCLRREIAELRRSHPKFWFCDVSEIIGGQWWT